MNTTAPSTHTRGAEVDGHDLAAVTISVRWSDGCIAHEDHLHVE
ncbi:MAG: hypothetical protein AB2792_16295 [Candidatus Thiodiazotropha sp.]